MRRLLRAPTWHAVLAASCGLARRRATGGAPGVSPPTADGGDADDAGYRFFEDQCPPEKPPERFASYEDQLLGATASRYEAPVQRTDLDVLRARNEWKEDSKRNVQLAPDRGWNDDDWQPAPGEEGHVKWYEKPSHYMSNEEQAKYDHRHDMPILKGDFRHQKQAMAKHAEARAQEMFEDEEEAGRISRRSFKDRNPDVSIKSETKAKYVGAPRQDFLNDWLQKPDVTPRNAAEKVAEHYNITDRMSVATTRRSPEWQMTPVDEDD